MALQRIIVILFMLSLLFARCSTADLPQVPRGVRNDVNGSHVNKGGASGAPRLGSLRHGNFKGLSLKSLERILAGYSTASRPVNVADFGAKGDGKTDDTAAFSKAWKKACSSGDALVVPKGKSYVLGPIAFSGPCKSDKLTVEIRGTLIASDDRSDYKKDRRHWILFEGVNNLSVEGGGTGIIDGNGKIWWENSCKTNKDNPCTDAPTALTFYKSSSLRVNNLKIRNAQQIHVTFERCNNVQASNLEVTAPEDSPNTDGIHVTGTQDMQITDTVIGTGDDCISIETGTQNLLVKDVTCGPGHGISIGSLGDDDSRAYVSGVTVDGAKISGTDNGIRIKTWQGGSGTAENIVFQNIEMENVKNPIIIDQFYCDQEEPCEEQKSAVEVKNVVYRNIKGTSATDEAVKLDCSKEYPCEGIVLQNIHLEGGGAECRNVARYTERGFVSPGCSS